MAVRIYTLAKELKLDSKVLVDLCTKAGITGKGSALASLTDEELAKLNAFLDAMKGKGAAPARPGARPAGPAGPIRREDYIGPASVSGKVPVLTSRRSQKADEPAVAAPAARATTVEPEAEEPESPESLAPLAPEPAIATREADGGPAVEELPPAPPRPAKPQLSAAELARLDVQRQMELERQRQLDVEARRQRERERGTQRGDKKKDDGDKPRERATPALKLAPMPASKGPVRREKPGEPAPQKPDIKLPLDAIRASKAGAKPLAEHIRKQEEKRLADKRGQRGPAEVSAEAGPGLTLPGRDRPKRAGARPGEVVEREDTTTQRRLVKRKRPGTGRRREGDEDDSLGARRPTHIKRIGSKTAAPRKGRVQVELPCTVREFSEAVGVPARVILGKLLELGTMTNIAAQLDSEMAELLAVELGLEVDFRREAALEDTVVASAEDEVDDPEKLVPRPPVITVLGHVDHGKTSLLDRILGLKVAAGEKGGITQHIRAYQVEKDGRKITFVDTPGHEAFTEMRARGANVTDIAVLVVAADDGVMPQTEEAISHAKAAGVPIVVALNKVDLPGINFDRIYQQLATAELLPTEWGGDTEVVKTSAVTGEGIDTLLETLLTVAELHDYKANPDRAAVGTCLEASLSEGRGVIGKLLVQKGTLRVGDIVVCGPSYGRVKAMFATLNERERLEEAGPSTPVHVTGLDSAPGAGDRFHVLADIAEARQVAESRQSKARQTELVGTRPHVTLENLFERLGEQDQVQTLNVILRADTRGSIEAIRKELGKLHHAEVQVKILQATVGGITEADVHLADASDAIIIGFSVVPDEAARVLADKRGVQVRRYDIIYQLTDDLRMALQGMLKPERQEKELGRALVQQAFHISRVGTVAGCRVLSGNVQRDGRVRVIRESRIIGEYNIESLRREKDDTREVREGMECGIKLANFNDVKEGDILEVYKIEEIARTL